MEILISGGNGFVGHHLVQALLERGESVRVLALPSEDTARLEALGVRIHRGDIRDPRTLVAPTRGVDAVFHLAAMMDVWRPIEDYRAVNVTGTENVCRAAIGAGVRRLVHMSSSSVYGMGLRGPADETYPLRPFPDPYPVTKAEGDKVVQRMIQEDHLPAVIIRPDQIFGPGDHLHFGQMANRVRSGRAIIVGSGSNLMPFVYVTDVIQGLMLALDHPSAVGQAYNLSSERPMTQLEFISAIAFELGAVPPRMHVPYRALYATGYVAERIARLRGSSRRPPVTRMGVSFFGTSNRYSIDKAKRGLGYVPKVSLRDGIRLAAAWYRERHDDEVAAPPAWNQVVIVTGASSGIGAAAAREIARRGAHVVLAARRAEALDSIVGGIQAAGGTATAVVTDLADSTQVARLGRAAAALGPVGVLVNCAGVNWSRSFASTTADEIKHSVDVNLVGAMLLTRAVLPGMLERRRGAIISVGSLSGRVAMEPVYSATKYGLRGFSLALRRQLDGSGVSVSLVSPGKIRTAMTSSTPDRLPEPELVAIAIADLITHPRREIVIPRRHYAIAWLEQALPSLADLAYRWRHWSPVH